MKWLLGRDRPMIERVARWAAMVACVWFALAVAWGLFGAIGSGHYGTMASLGIAAENMLQWKIWGAVGGYSAQKPPMSDYACHHPFGVFWTTTLMVAIFGHHDWVISFPAVAMSAATPPLLYKMAKESWGVLAGAAAACGFVVVPIALGFGNYHSLEAQVIFGWALFFWGHARLLATHRTRYMLASLAGAFVATDYDWPGFVAIGIVLGWGLLRLMGPARVFPKLRFAPYARWWILTATLCVIMAGLWVYLFQKANKLSDWLASGDTRGGDGTPLAQALQARRYWIEIMFTPIAITIGKIAAPIAFARVVVRRRDCEVYVVAVLLTAIAQYVGFKRGADVHIFWPHYFALYYALAAAILVATVEPALRWLLSRVRVRVRVAALVAAAVALAVGVVPSLMMVPDAARSLRLGRETGGRYNNNGEIIRSNLDALFVLSHVVRPATPRGAVLDVSPSLGFGWEYAWALGGMSTWVTAPKASQPADTQHPFWIARASAMTSAQLLDVVSTTHARFYGDVVLVDQREAPAPLDAYSMNEREPNLFEWYFVSGVEPMRSVGAAPDPFLTWEWRVHLGQPAEPPTAQPKTLDELRIAHNVAIAQGDSVRAEQLRERIDAQLDRTVSARWDQGVTLIGIRVDDGVQPKIEAWFQAGGPTRGDAYFGIRSVVIKRDPLSSIPPDATEREMAYPPPLSPKLWKAGFLYHEDTPLLHRIGYERYWAAWRSRDAAPAPERIDGEHTKELVVIR